MDLELLLSWCSLALWGVHGDFQPEGQNHGEPALQDPNPRHPQPCRTQILSTPSSCRATGLVEQLLGGPSVPIASCHIPTAPGEVVQLLLLGEDPWGLFVCAVGCGILGVCSPAVPWGSSGSGAVPSAFLSCLIYCSLLGNGEGGELAFLGVGPGCCSPLLPKKVPSPFHPFPGSLSSGRLSLEAGWSFGSLGIKSRI